MPELSLDQLNDLLEGAAKKVVVGSVYEHYKGQAYTVTGLVIWEDTNEVAVVYKANYDTRLTFARALSVWLETVEVGGRSVPRFRLVE